MAGDQRLYFQRFEYKYVIPESVAEAVRDFVSSYLTLDEHAVGNPGGQYLVCSLYLDAPNLGLYEGTLHGDKNRFKLRVRCYDDRPDTPAFFEVKRRMNNIILKKRAAVRKDRVEQIIGLYRSELDDLVSVSDPRARARSYGALQRFCELSSRISARPKMLIRYWREAYVDPSGGSVRVTFDRKLSCLRTDEAIVKSDGPGWLSLPDQRVVLEIKFSDLYPNWARDLIEAYSIVRASASKYIRSVDALIGSGVRVAG